MHPKPEGQAHLQFAQTNAVTQNCKRACPANTRKKKQRNANNELKVFAHTNSVNDILKLNVSDVITDSKVVADFTDIEHV